jgi:general secretion pathway protein M
MNTAAATAPAAALRQQLAARWQALAPRERKIVGIGAALVCATLLWLLAVAPAMKVLRSATAQLEQLDAQLQAMQRDATDAAQLRAIAPVSAAQSAAALRASSDALGAAGKLVISGDRATLTLTNAVAQQMRDWLADARATARARVVEVNLTQSSGSVSGTIVVSLPGGGA